MEGSLRLPLTHAHPPTLSPYTTNGFGLGEVAEPEAK